MRAEGYGGIRCDVRLLRIRIHQRNRAARDANQPLILVFNADFPYLGRPPLVQGRSGRPEHPFFFGPNVVGVDFQPKSDLLRRRRNVRTHRGHRLRQYHARPPVKISVWLMHARRYRHGCHNAIRPDLLVLDTEEPVE